ASGGQGRRRACCSTARRAPERRYWPVAWRARPAPTFSTSAPPMSSKWYGEAEQRMQGVFEKARNATPAIVFFDEIDALAPHRDGAHEVTHRVVSTMLEYMDGLEAIEGVVVIAATNRPEALDPAIVRPGRFDRLVEI